MTTKEQERKALEKIKKIVAELGPDSYVGTAFEGCFEDAETNIENDFAFSMAQRVGALEGKVASLEIENCDLSIALKKETERANTAETRYNELKQKQLSPDDLADFEAMLKNAMYDCEQLIKKEAAEIVRMADTPQDVAFLDAVTSHRREQKNRQYLAGILARVNRAQGQN